MSITDYEPKQLWKRFDEIRKIPRCSGSEERARQYVSEIAKGHSWDWKADTAGNLVVRVPATRGHEKAPTVVLQSHLDMVCEKNREVKHDFDKDPIELRINDDWLTANGTTLGSDNGVGVAACLAAAEDETVVHGPLELLFTVEEETGLTGAGKLEPGFISGKFMLNLDSEELGSVFIGCAGGGDSTITLPIKRTAAPAGTTALRVSVTGLRGGHSGLDIVEQRGNAIKILARALWEAREQQIVVASIDGGNKRNAIPREATAVVYAPNAAVERFREHVTASAATAAIELGGHEKELAAGVDSLADAPGNALEEASQSRLLNLLLAIPHGVEAMNYDIPDLVETSNNLASVNTSDGEVVIGTSSRSSINTALQHVRDRIRAAADLAGAKVVEDEAYPGWSPNVNSELLKVAKKVHKELLGSEPEAKAIHAGLECGIIGERFAGMDMISFGPRIEHPHSPDERIHIASVGEFWTLLAGLLEALA